MAEVAPSGGGGGNRNFLLLIGGLGALLVIAMLALGAIFVLPALLGPSQISAVATPSPTRIVIQNTPTRAPQASPTLVVVAQNTVAATRTETPDPLITATAIPITATPIMITATPDPNAPTDTNGQQQQLPDSGLGEDLLLLFGGGILLLGVIVVVRRMRSV
jgi:hypothetical protein